MTPSSSPGDISYRKKVYIAQLHFRIGVIKEFVVLGEFLRSGGVEVRYLLAENYGPHISEDQKAYCDLIKGTPGGLGLIMDTIRFVFLGWLGWSRFFLTSKPDCFLLYSMHPLSLGIFLVARITAPRCKLVLCTHEPETQKSVVSLKAKMEAYIREHLQGLSVALCRDVVVFSPFAEERFRRRYRHFKGIVHQTCLVLPRVALPDATRDAVNISTTLYPDGRSRLFVDLVRLGEKLAPDLKFRLVTGSRIDKQIRMLVESKPSNFELVNPDFLSDETIMGNINRAYVQILGHKNITQSGVLPIAFQCGTPVLARNLRGFSQFIRHKENGYLVPPDASPEEWFEGIRYILEHFDEMSEACRRSYDNLFAPQNLGKYYEWIYRTSDDGNSTQKE